MRLSTTLPLFAALVPLASATQSTSHQLPLVGEHQSYESDLLHLHRALVEHSSVTDNEGYVAAHLTGYLRNRNFTVKLQPVTRGRHNVLPYYGSDRATRVLVTSHIDTVPPFFPYERRGDQIWGRGSADAKGSVASQIIAVEELSRTGAIATGDVALLFVVGEERGGMGMKAANDLGLQWESVIFGEPTELKLGRGHKGGLAFTVNAHGLAGHSGYPELGRNAIDVLVQGLAALAQVELPGSERFGNTTFNVGLIEGGVAGNVIPANASATVVVRTASYDLQSIKAVIEKAVTGGSEWLSVDWANCGIGPVPIDHDAEGFETAVFSYGTDIISLQGSHKRYLYGPGSILVAHSDHEYVTIGDLLAAVNGYKRLIAAVLA
ncbi:hypothetical protein LTR95_001165 [Oleoguttula sp. CCFEE 5521]